MNVKTSYKSRTDYGQKSEILLGQKLITQIIMMKTV